MDREILFRGKRTDNGEWVEGYYAKSGGCFILKDNGLTYGGFEIFEVSSETVCRYTGYEDVNGKKIFEGDIVGYIDMTSTESGYSEMDCVGVVGWSEEEACFYVTGRLSAESWEVLGECRIIGNIYDKPELLEGGTE